MRSGGLACLVAALIGCGQARRPVSPEESVERAARYLWSKQAPDGGWHSETYGLLRSGQSLTPFVLLQLLRVPSASPAGGVERALRFIRSTTDRDGAVGRADPMLADYPS